jgi:antirestriction protein ArdC
MSKLYDEISAKIAAELEAGAAPWVKPWSSTPGQNTPCNAVTNRPYSGCNVVMLWIARERGWPTPRFLTFKQAKALGGTVRGGETGSHVFFVKRITVKDKKTEEDKAISMMKVYSVFNVAQCDGLPESIVKGPSAETAKRNPGERIELVDAFVRTTGADIREGAGEAYYAPGADFISMPSFESFRDAANFYGTTLHELGHWTGHNTRLDRNLKTTFGTKDYAAEELTAELTAAFLCAEFSIDGELRHAGYIANWAKLLRDDSRAFFTACSRAQKAADYLRSKALADEEDSEAIAA